MKKHPMLLAAFLGAAAMLTACGGSDDPPPPPPAVTPAQASVPINATVVGAVDNVDFEFPAGVTEFGTGGATTMTFTGTGTTPPFRITSAGGVASGTTRFGSCIFDVVESTFPAGHPLAAGGSVTISDCELEVILENMPADGSEQTKTARAKLNSAISTGKPVKVTATADGKLIIDGVEVATVPVSPVTGS